MKLDDAIHDVTEPSTSTAKPVTAFLKQGPAFFNAVDVKERPIAPFILKPKLPRVLRQKVIDKLMGEHLALAALKADASTLDPKNAAADPALVKKCGAAAMEQEEQLYTKCTSKQVYQNIAARTSAYEWEMTKAKARQKGAEEAYQALLAEERKEFRESGRREHKRLKLDNEAQPTEVSNIGALEEAELDWGAPSQKDAERQRKHVRSQVIDIMDKSDHAQLLTAEQKVLVANRCTAKWLEKRSKHDEEEMAVLVDHYIDRALRATLE